MLPPVSSASLGLPDVPACDGSNVEHSIFLLVETDDVPVTDDAEQGSLTDVTTGVFLVSYL